MYICTYIYIHIYIYIWYHLPKIVDRSFMTLWQTVIWICDIYKYAKYAPLWSEKMEMLGMPSHC